VLATVVYCYAGYLLEGRRLRWQIQFGPGAVRWLVDVPTKAMAVYLLACAVMPVFLTGVKDRRIAFLLAVPAAAVGWLIFFIVCFPAFEDIDP
jgi:hypothetical protein